MLKPSNSLYRKNRFIICFVCDLTYWLFFFLWLHWQYVFNKWEFKFKFNSSLFGSTISHFWHEFHFSSNLIKDSRQMSIYLHLSFFKPEKVIWKCSVHYITLYQKGHSFYLWLHKVSHYIWENNLTHF